MAIKDDAFFAVVALALVGGAAWYAKKKIGNAATTVLPYINPANSNNVVNQAATSIYQGLTGSTDTIGGALYDYFHPIPSPTAPTGPQTSPVIQTVSNNGADLAASGYLDTGQFMGP